mmetsp:Transcript_7174/g.25601  ORF Transcript_7174/g.25601 Transcript_7174/m.25601 type:complete len:276 (-) Transcript_7174:6541-7368(-)
MPDAPGPDDDDADDGFGSPATLKPPRPAPRRSSVEPAMLAMPAPGPTAEPPPTPLMNDMCVRTDCADATDVRRPTLVPSVPLACAMRAASANDCPPSSPEPCEPREPYVVFSSSAGSSSSTTDTEPVTMATPPPIPAPPPAGRAREPGRDTDGAIETVSPAADEPCIEMSDASAPAAPVSAGARRMTVTAPRCPRSVRLQSPRPSQSLIEPSRAPESNAMGLPASVCSPDDATATAAPSRRVDTAGTGSTHCTLPKWSCISILRRPVRRSHTRTV